MSLARRATPEDAEELVRLRKVMQDSYLGPDPDVSWQSAAVATLRKKLADPDADLTAFVVERPGGLAACAVGTIEYRLGGPGNPNVEAVFRDPDASATLIPVDVKIEASNVTGGWTTPPEIVPFLYDKVP